MTKSLFTTLLFIGTLTLNAQWECPSKLRAHLDPVFNSSVLVGLETQLSTGILNKNTINTAMGFMGVDYTTQKHSFYFEGGFKAWWKYNADQEEHFDQYRLGVREMLYQYKSELSDFTLGIQSSTLNDHYLLNERLAGANYKLDLGRWNFNASAGSVTKNFARNGIFCTTSFIYDLSTNQNQVLIGNSLGDKNMGGLTLTFYPAKDKKTKTKAKPSNEDEFDAFEDDEFNAFESNTQQNTKDKPSFAVEKIGFAAYTEFGDWIDNTFYQSGIFASIKLPGDIYLNPEALIQLEESNQGLIYMAKLQKSLSLKNGNRLSLGGAYYGFSEIDKNAMVLNSYSNILAGEVLRLDAVNMPFYLFSAKLNIPAAKFHVKLQNLGQINSGDLSEWDMEIGKKFKDRLFVNLKGGIINGESLSNKAYLGRLEARFYF